jgi:hypothetical protein
MSKVPPARSSFENIWFRAPAFQVSDLYVLLSKLYLSWCSSAPRVAGLPVKMFAWVLETPILGPIVLYILKKDNLVNKVIKACSHFP